MADLNCARDCAYHSQKWRARTQAVLKILRQKELLKPSHSRRFPRVVCTCKERQDIALPDVRSDALEEWLSGIRGKEEYNGLAKHLSYMLMASNTADNKKSLLRTIRAVYQIFQGSVVHLVPPPTEPPPDDSPVIDKVKEEFLLDFPAPYLGPLLGRQGVHLKNLCQKHGITNIYLGKKDDRGKRPYIYMSPFPVSYEYVAGDDKVGGFRKALDNWASLVKEKRDKHALAREQFNTKRRNLAIYRREMRETQQYNDNPKEFAQQAFDAKSKHNKERRKKPPVLVDSHCRQCLTPFTQDNGVCKYHPGYIVEWKRKKKVYKVWSCCRRFCHTDNTSVEEHSRTGCQRSHRHQWRLHNKKGKGKTKLVTSDDLDI